MSETSAPVAPVEETKPVETVAPEATPAAEPAAEAPAAVSTIKLSLSRVDAHRR